MKRKIYPSDVKDDEWAFVAPYLTLMTEYASQPEYSVREVFNGLRWLVRTQASWEFMPHDLPPWPVVYEQTQRWLRDGVFEDIVYDLYQLLRLAAGRKAQSANAIIDGWGLRSTPKSGLHTGYDDQKRRKGSKIPLAVENLGQLLSLQMTPINEQERAKLAELSQQVQAVTGEQVKITFVDQGYLGEEIDSAVETVGIKLEVVKLPETKHGFVLLPKEWVVERNFAWSTKFRRLARDYERLAGTLNGVHF